MTAPGPERRVRTVFIGVLVSLSLAAFTQTFVSTALPTMVGDLGGYESLSWVVTGYLLASAVVVPFAGKLADVYGSSRLFQIAILVFVAGSLMAGAATSIEMLIAARCLQGVGGGAILTLSFSLTARLVAPRERGRYQGYIASLFTVANVAGPLLGGFFVDHLSWRWAFHVTVVAGIVALLVVRRNVPSEARGASEPLDFTGGSLLVISLVTAMLVTTWGGQQYAWSSPVVLALIVVSIVTAAIFVPIERSAIDPVLPLDLLARPNVRMAAILGFLAGLAMTTIIAYTPTFMQVALDVSATTSGMLLAPLMICVTIASTIGGRVMSRTARYRPAVVVGSGLLASGTGLLAATATSSVPLVLPSIGVGLVGLGVGLSMPSHLVAAQNTVAPQRLGTATSTIQFTRKIGSTLGVAVAGGLLTVRASSHLRNAGALAPGESIDSVLEEPSRIAQLPADVEAAVRAGVASGARAVFVVAFVASVLCFAMSFVLPDDRLDDELDEADLDDPGAGMADGPRIVDRSVP